MSPVARRKAFAFQSSKSGRYVSGSSANATKNAADDMIRVTQSGQRQLRVLLDTSQPLATGARTGPTLGARHVSNYRRRC